MQTRYLWTALALSLAGNGYLLLQRPPSAPSPEAPNEINAIQASSSFSEGLLPAQTQSAPQGGSQRPDITYLEGLLESGKFALLQQELQRALRRFPDDPALLMLEGELIVNTRPLSDALLHLYNLAEKPLPYAERQALNERISHLLRTAMDELRAANNWDLLARFLEPLFQLQPDSRLFTLQLAEAYARQGKPNLTEDVLASLPPGDPDAQSIRDLLKPEVAKAPAAERPRSADEGLSLQLQPRGAHFIANVRFANVPAQLIFDTGATTTAISSALFNRLSARGELPFIGIFEVATAAGRVSAQMVQVPVVQFGPFRYTYLSVLVLPDNVMDEADGLLGMNVLKNTDFRLNQLTGELIVYPHSR
ncbi:retroviral-like aspartic protease family protein [Alteromonas sp. ASW11-19]|uniref:Retroviral-like aspartic protease family protein n=1 Tax=Alteromonas salexigens TaxID=2982530 RepID=A0ABT2VRK4_9ALTE|nr:retropepsin-like aspartic protease [Alteromonas salexigens]MCU7555949.1 retroviral-like aspartic protease family protein [Alteromonas salexigens]